VSAVDLVRALKAIRRSIWVYHLNSGSCNACDIEVLDALTPYFDVERFGIKLVGSPRHADVVLFTGPVTRESLPKVVRALKAMPRPRLLLVLGSCGVGGGIWWDTYATTGGFSKLEEILREQGVEVDRVVYVPGCPVRPEAIIYGVLVLLGLAEQKVREVEVHAPGG
jgi:Ni,Fe-hydrogenase III small subunit